MPRTRRFGTSQKGAAQRLALRAPQDNPRAVTPWSFSQLWEAEGTVASVTWASPRPSCSPGFSGSTCTLGASPCAAQGPMGRRLSQKRPWSFLIYLKYNYLSERWCEFPLRKEVLAALYGCRWVHPASHRCPFSFSPCPPTKISPSSALVTRMS